LRLREGLCGRCFRKLAQTPEQILHASEYQRQWRARRGGRRVWIAFGRLGDVIGVYSKPERAEACSKITREFRMDKTP
jgi:hypothetical protein